MKTFTGISLVGICVVPFLNACGGGSSSSLQNDPVSSSGDLCDNSYYSQLKGQYDGKVEYIDLPVRQCEWDVSISVTPASRLLGCSLNATVESTVTQLIVYDAADPEVYQCMDTQATYLLNEPYDYLSPATLFDDVVFPVDVQVEGDSFASSFGPYFGDTTVDVPYVRLFDTGGALVELLTFNADNTITVRGGNPPFFTFDGTLTKE
jgi:hypothetical protein